jgi:hypothetical protein
MFVYVGVFVHYKFPFEEWFDWLSNMYQQKIGPYYLMKYQIEEHFLLIKNHGS